MAEKRILVPFESLTPEQRGDYWWIYADLGFIHDCTRPLDVRGWDDWTEDEKDEYRLRAGVHQYAVYAGAALDIATRPAPEPDPWEEMEKELNDVATDVINEWGTGYAFAVVDAWRRLKATRSDK